MRLGDKFRRIDVRYPNLDWAQSLLTKALAVAAGAIAR
jgi:hypothetical protein